jgi:hypothetical protein
MMPLATTLLGTVTLISCLAHADNVEFPRERR